MEEIVEDFIAGCQHVKGELVEKRYSYDCILNDSQKIVMDKEGKWVKGYDRERVEERPTVSTWFKPAEVEIVGGGESDFVPGMFINQGELMPGKINVRMDYIHGRPKKGEVTPPIAEIPVASMDGYIAPDFKEKLERQRKRGKVLGERRQSGKPELRFSMVSREGFNS